MLTWHANIVKLEGLNGQADYLNVPNKMNDAPPPLFLILTFQQLCHKRTRGSRHISVCTHFHTPPPAPFPLLTVTSPHWFDGCCFCFFPNDNLPLVMRGAKKEKFQVLLLFSFDNFHCAHLSYSAFVNISSVFTRK